jgi:hypothetical protein
MTDNALGRGTGNGVMYTAEYAYLLHTEQYDLGYPEFLKEKFRLIELLASCQVMPGLFKRSPTHKTPNAPDDYFGAALSSKYLNDGRTASNILSYGRQSWGCYNDQAPGVWRWKSWFYRMPQLVAHWQFCAGQRVDLFLLLIWCVSVYRATTRPRKSQDSYRKLWMMLKAADGYNKLLDWYIAWIRKRFAKVFPGGIGQVEKEYGWTANPKKGRPVDHPIIKHLWGDL